MANIKFGPAGLGPVKDAINNLKKYSSLGLRACEVAFTYGVYFSKEEAKKIGAVAKKLGIQLSIHSPYYVNLNSKEEEKIIASQQRILKCAEIGHYLGAKRIVFHPGYYSGMEKADALKNISERILDMKKIIDREGYDVMLCPELMGKINVFGSMEEISSIVKLTGTSFCIDFAHNLARSGGDYGFKDALRNFPQRKWHVHFSGIIYGKNGEKRHRNTKIEEWKKLLNFLIKQDKEITIISEAPECVEDAVLGHRIYEELKKQN